MSTTGPANANSPAVVWWAIWASLLGMVFVIGGKFLNEPAMGSLPWFVALVPFCASMLLRFLLLPKATARRKAFVLFILGISMSEMTGLIGVLAANEKRETLLLLALLGIVVHMPTFLKKLPAD